ncbi:MAG: hypothetical protein CMG29_01150 [Candidatus Marinimicrobia bacterium]|jgi:hypothetical protein|nr:hypothetical protein [Candidatus Neomarinimicrobiota bacterium]HBN45043.1 hypothetical protein [Candidatus Neomarinimicrobiota bacterium]|tara:strand:- start:2343 stop:2531 length:189 start_codon:yes stop_codon:yes gene_type:complete
MPLVPSYIKNLANCIPGKPIDVVQREMSIDEVNKLTSNENSQSPSGLPGSQTDHLKFCAPYI